jgi:hypothetical protein
LILSSVLLASPATAGGSPRSMALETYFERCGIDPESSHAERAHTDYEQLVDMGYRPAQILALVEEFPRECSYISFKAAVMGEKRKQEQRALGTFQPKTMDLDRPKRMLTEAQLERRYPEIQGPDPDDLITSDALGLRGLRQGLHDDYAFGMTCTVLFGIGALLGVTFTAIAANSWVHDCFLFSCGYGHDGNWVWGAAGTWAVTGVFGVTAAIMGIKVESRREHSYGTYRDYEVLSSPRLRLSVGPGGVTVRF